MKKYTYFLILLFPISAAAEVSDKMATQQGLWLSGLLTGLVVAVCIRWSKWTNLIAIPLAVMFLYFAYDTLAQPNIGPAIIKEQGTPYIVALYGSAILVVIGVLIGNSLNKLKVSSSA
jgi:CBS-domain-containing membrane protein